MRRTVGAAGVIGIVLLAGCGGGGGVDLGAVAPCELLTGAELSEIGFDPGSARPADGGGLRSCSWSTPSAVIPVPSVLMVIPDAGLDEVRAGLGGFGDTPQDGEIAGYPSLRTGAEPCAVYVDLGSGVLGMTASTDCDTAQRAVELAIGNLPS